MSWSFPALADEDVAFKKDAVFKDVVLKAGENGVCPAGFICNLINGNEVDVTDMQNCTILQQDVEDAGFGPVLDGIYCPNGSANIKNCPPGFYCENPADEPVKCTEKFFCPTKTKTPQLKCNACKGEEIHVRYAAHTPSVIVLVVATLVSPLAYIIFSRVMTRRRDQEKLREDQSRAEKEEAECKKTNMAESQRINPMLEMIGRGLGEGNNLKLDYSAQLFDSIDHMDIGVISYAKLNKTMDMTSDQLAIFIRLMNEAAENAPTALTISRETFVNCFMPTILAVGNLTPTGKDAAVLFDEIAEENCENTSTRITSSIRITSTRLRESMNTLAPFFAPFLSNEQKQIIPLKALKLSHLTTFLSDKQILFMFRLFQEKLRTHDTPVPVDEETQVIPQSTRSGNGFEVLRKESSNTRLTSSTIERADFISWYPSILKEVLLAEEETQLQSFDLQFQDLSLRIQANGIDFSVVNNVSGRIRQATMTALMGGSGAGKTSLLNALCGRAYYGTVSGKIMINGNVAKIEDHKDVMGFVPQDDIVFSELTVFENLVFAGRFKLPRGTPIQEIECLAEEVIADLGLTRVTDSIVGDVYRRGVSGGEKKRVNIGLELMARPSILFLDEPTSGLDASSAMVVMTSLHRLVTNQGMTVCSVIHQPRKQIFELFDSLCLLGVGGRTVYNGPVKEAQSYFTNMRYELPDGESLADWLIDISSGRLSQTALDRPALARQKSEKIVEIVGDREAANRSRLYTMWENHFGALSAEERKSYEPPEAFELPSKRVSPGFLVQTLHQFRRCVILFKRNLPTKLQETVLIVFGSLIITLLDGTLELTKKTDPNIPFEFYALATVKTDNTLFAKSLPSLFKHALNGASVVTNYATKIAIVISVLVALSATKALTEKRVEFFREAGSGYDTHAYFLAINLFSTVEVSVKMLLAAIYCFTMRNTAAHPGAAVLHFILLGWISASWGLLFPIFVPPKNVYLVTAFFLIFGGLLLSGGSDPVLYKDIYEKPTVGLISGLFSAPRFFIESLAVNEYRATPWQHGFTVDFKGAFQQKTSFTNSFRIRGLAQNDASVSEFTENGWYWGVVPSICVGLAIRFLAAILLQVCDRPQQLKKSLREEMWGSCMASMKIIGLVCVFSAFLALSIVSFLE